jgi:hypothetical protein
MRDTTMSNDEQELRSILRDAEAVYKAGNFEEMEHVAKRVPEGSTLVILTTGEHGPCFCIMPLEDVGDLTSRFRCAELVRPVVSSTSVEEPEVSSEPDGPTLADGFHGSVELGEETGRGNL